MSKVQNFYLRIVIATVTFLVIIYLLWKIFVGLSNLTEKNPDTDPHGFPGVMLGVCISPLLFYWVYYVQKGTVKAPHHILDETNINPTTLIEPIETDGLRSPGLKATIVIMVISIFWIVASLYCQLLNQAIYEAATDKSIIGVNILPIQAEKLTITIGGAIYNGCFFPLAAGIAFLGGWVSKDRISYKVMLIPGLCLYGLQNIITFINGGKPSAVLTAEHISRTFREGGQAVPQTSGTTALTILIALSIFIFIVLCLALYGWIWLKIGRWIFRLAYKKR